MKKNKYNASKTIVDDIIFDSKKEAQRYLQLKNDPEVKELKLQVKFELQPKYENGLHRNIRSIDYIADFTYIKNNEFVIEDTKGIQTDTFKLKRKLFEKIYYPLTITII